MLELAYGSRASLAMAPVQDVLGLGSEGRMNTPGTMGGNWQWRLRRGQLTPKLAARLRALAEASGRAPG
jgi:4-alpha-glucanotransferase